MLLRQLSRADQLPPQPLGGNSVKRGRGLGMLDCLRSFNIREYVPLFIER
jgi:hypothetical protein